MIVKSNDLTKIKKEDYKIILLYGENNGLKEEVINKLINKSSGELSKFDESEIIENYESFLVELLNKSLFVNSKIIIISRVTYKIISFIEEVLERNIDGIKIFLNAGNLDKKSKLRSFFEKSKVMACVPFYPDDEKGLSFFANNFLSQKKIKISREILNIILERARGDRSNLKNELEKIEALSITKKNISTDDIVQLSNLSENYNIFELVDNYLAKNQKKVSKIINENNFVNDDCILIIRTLLSRSKRLLNLKIKERQNLNKDEIINSFKPPIFWKEKVIVKKQMSEWSEEEIKNKIFKLADLEILVKSNNSGINLVSDFVNNY